VRFAGAIRWCDSPVRFAGAILSSFSCHFQNGKALVSRTKTDKVRRNHKKEQFD
jgi:hypothetical protein